MFASEIQNEIGNSLINLPPRWLRIPAAVKYSGLSRSVLYKLLANGKIRSICLRSHKNTLRGVRLVDREAIDRFMLALQSEPAQLTSRNKEEVAV
jgi:hypothetical protein